MSGITDDASVQRDTTDRSAHTHWLALVIVAGLVVSIDQVTKAIVRRRLAYGATMRVVGVRLHHTRNDGLLGGLVHGAAVPVGIITVVGVAAALVAYARHPGVSMPIRIGAGLLLGGTIGNLADRLRLGYVTDFIARGDRNAFNLADLAIYAGITILVVWLVVGDRIGRRRG